MQKLGNVWNALNHGPLTRTTYVRSSYFLTWTSPECFEGVATLELVVLLGCALLPHLTVLRQSGKA